MLIAAQLQQPGPAANRVRRGGASRWISLDHRLQWDHVWQVIRYGASAVIHMSGDDWTVVGPRYSQVSHAADYSVYQDVRVSRATSD